MDEIVFKSQSELYDRIKPALRSKRKILVKAGFNSISERDIWDYMRYSKWISSTGLELCEMVDDILHVDNQLIVDYSCSKYMHKEEDISQVFDMPKLAGDDKTKLNSFDMPKLNDLELPKSNGFDLPKLKS